jgi:hypothetical protein
MAIKTMMAKDAKGYCEYVRLATYHAVYCNHGVESFPGWHRAYIADFECTLRRADIANGGDGRIGLPYWDWTSAEVNGQTYPAALVVVAHEKKNTASGSTA